MSLYTDDTEKDFRTLEDEQNMIIHTVDSFVTFYNQNEDPRVESEADPYFGDVQLEIQTLTEDTNQIRDLLFKIKDDRYGGVKNLEITEINIDDPALINNRYLYLPPEKSVITGFVLAVEAVAMIVIVVETEDDNSLHIELFEDFPEDIVDTWKRKRQKHSLDSIKGSFVKAEDLNPKKKPRW